MTLEIGRGSYLETSIASAATCDIGAASTLFVAITGTTTITSFGPVAHRMRFVRFAAALTLTHNATSLILPHGDDIITAAGDTAFATSDGSGNWRVHRYTHANGPLKVSRNPDKGIAASVPVTVTAPALYYPLNLISDPTGGRAILISTPDYNFAGSLGSVFRIAFSGPTGNVVPYIQATQSGDHSTNTTIEIRGAPRFPQILSAAFLGTDGSGNLAAVTTISVADNIFTVKGSSDATKKLAFEVDTNIATGTTRTWTAQNADMTVAGIDVAGQTFTKSQKFQALGNTTAVQITTPSAGLGLEVLSDNTGRCARFGTSDLVDNVAGTMLRTVMGAVTGDTWFGFSVYGGGGLNTQQMRLQDNGAALRIGGTFQMATLTAGFVRTDASGFFSSSALVNADIPSTLDSKTITNATIGNTNTVTVKGTSFTLQDATDTTKQARFSMAGIGTGTTATYTLPAASQSLAGLATANSYSQNQTISTTGSSRWTISKASGAFSAGFVLQTAGIDRWSIIANVTSESGSDAGSDIDFVAKSDAGSTLGTWQSIRRSDGLITLGGAGLIHGGPSKLKSYTVATVPSAASWTGAMIYVSNESGGAVPAFSDGTNWRRTGDRAIIS